MSSVRSRKVRMSGRLFFEAPGLLLISEKPSLWQIAARCGGGGAWRLPGSLSIGGLAVFSPCCGASGVEVSCQVACDPPQGFLGSCSILTNVRP